MTDTSRVTGAALFEAIENYVERASSTIFHVRDHAVEGDEVSVYLADITVGNHWNDIGVLPRCWMAALFIPLPNRPLPSRSASRAHETSGTGSVKAANIKPD
jgi:hypothetical protein